jgi:disulfide bond formation protein DsbB
MSSFVQFAINASAIATVIVDVFVIFLFIILLTPLQTKGFGKKVATFFGRHSINFTFLIGALSVIGSLFFSEVAGFVPCELCWIQRGLLYTLALILLIGLIARKDERRRAFDNFMRKCGLIFAGIGFPIAAYNLYLQLGGGAIIPCSATGPSCSLVYFLRFGYVTIPTMSLTAFALIIALMLFGEGMREE